MGVEAEKMKKKQVQKNIRTKINENCVKIFQNEKQNNNFNTAGSLFKQFYFLWEAVQRLNITKTD